MPTLIPYPVVLQTMRATGMKSLYHNSGAFGFIDQTNLHHRGWLIADDPTLRPAARDYIHLIAPPAISTLTTLATKAWQTLAPGDAWILPMSHWAYELDFGSPNWLPQALRDIHIDPAPLQSLNQAPALSFTPAESPQFQQLLTQLLTNLDNSDFAIAFPTHPIRCTLHHHKQLWWTTNNPAFGDRLNAISAP